MDKPFKIDPVMEDLLLDPRERWDPPGDPWFTYHDFYKWIVDHKDFTRFAEVGVWKGRSISYLADLLRERKNLELYAIDLWTKTYGNYTEVHGKDVKIVDKLYAYQLRKTNTRHLIKDIVGCSWEVAKQFDDGYFDFVFIDADHTHAGVRKDIVAWRPKVKKGGILAGDDFGIIGSVRTAVKSSFSKEELILQKTPGKPGNVVWYVKI